MNQHFLTSINIEQFKCFHNFSASGFKRVNLIGGKNNIGKTAFLEACFINVNAKDVEGLFSAISTIKFIRETVNLATNVMHGLTVENLSTKYLMMVREYAVESNLHRQKFQLDEKNAVRTYEITLSTISDKISIHESDIYHLSFPMNHHAYIMEPYGFSNSELALIFQSIQKNDREAELNALLQEFDPSIEAFKMIGNQPQCKINGEYQDLTELGSGFAHYIAIICALHACQNKHLFIDELGNGIHYSQLDKLWEVIFAISKRVQCQVFATTHSKEMLESFARVAKRWNEQDISYTTLVKNKQQEIKALTLDDELLQDSLAQEHEIR
jgi:AAA15 family ATPase/GTPase